MQNSFALEVFIVVDGGGDVVVVLDPFVLGDDVIGSLLVSHGVGSLEGLEELGENLLLGLLAGHDIWMLVSAVDATDVVNVDHAGAVLVHLAEGAHSDRLSVGGHGSTDGAEELVVLDETTAVEIEVSEEDLDFTLGEAEHVVRHCLAEFKLVQRHGMVIIHDSELLGESDDTAGTTGLQLVSEALEEVLAAGTAAGGGATDVSLEDLRGELSVVQGARAILVVKVVEGVQVLLIVRKIKINRE